MMKPPLTALLTALVLVSPPMATVGQTAPLPPSSPSTTQYAAARQGYERETRQLRADWQVLQRQAATAHGWWRKWSLERDAWQLRARENAQRAAVVNAFARCVADREEDLAARLDQAKFAMIRVRRNLAALRRAQPLAQTGAPIRLLLEANATATPYPVRDLASLRQSLRSLTEAQEEIERQADRLTAIGSFVTHVLIPAADQQLLLLGDLRRNAVRLAQAHRADADLCKQKVRACDRKTRALGGGVAALPLLAATLLLKRTPISG